MLQGGAKLVTAAHLTFDEQAWKWTDGDGNSRTVKGCVAALGVANNDFAASPPSDGNLYSYDVFVDVTPDATRDFEVTEPVANWFGPSNPRYGFVLKGSIEDVQNDDQSSCMSEISNVVLHLNYTVL